MSVEIGVDAEGRNDDDDDDDGGIWTSENRRP